MVSGFRRCANIWCRRPDSRVGEEGVHSACTHEMVTHERPSGAIHLQWQPTAQLTVSAPEGLSRRPRIPAGHCPGRRASSRLSAFCLPMPPWSLDTTPDRPGRGCLAIGSLGSCAAACRLLSWFAESDAHALTMVVDGVSSGCLPLPAELTVV